MRVSTVYVVAWSMLAVLSAGYLGLWVAQPEVLARWRIAPAERVMLGEAHLKDDIERLTLRIAELEARERSLTETVERLRPKTAAADDAPAAKVAAAVPPAEAAKSEAAKPEDGAVTVADAQRALTAPARPPLRVLNAEAPPVVSAIETGALPKAAEPAAPRVVAKAQPPARPVRQAVVEPKAGEPKAIEPKAPEAKAPERTGGVGVQLGGGTTLDALRLNWSLMSEQNEDLRRLEPRYTTSDAQGTLPYRLQAGPLPTREDAVKVCAELISRGMPCRVGSFGGSAL